MKMYYFLHGELGGSVMMTLTCVSHAAFVSIEGVGESVRMRMGRRRAGEGNAKSKVKVKVKS